MRTLVWLRRDLRLHDHPALHAAAPDAICCFVADPALLRGRARERWMLDALRVLDADLRERGSALVVRAGDPASVLPVLAHEAGAEAVAWTSDVSPYARRRDLAVSDALRAAGIEPRPTTGTYVTDVGKHEPQTVFSRFLKGWEDAPRRDVLPVPGALTPHELDVGALPDGPAGVPQPIVPPGEHHARRALHEATFAGESVLSPYLRYGQLSAREAEAHARALLGDAPPPRWPETGPGRFRRQLAWRDFYAHLLLHHPETIGAPLQPQYAALEFRADDAHVAAWRAGRTGFPFIDAGMRQLAAQGWMPNRARLAVGSFLVKDLHADWRVGYRWFDHLLLDGEPAQNMGNWQWIASVGVDPQPAARRLYNPTLQRRTHDPDGAWVRRWVPELRDVPTDLLDAPGLAAPDYPLAIVDHAVERAVALERYRRAGEQDVPT